MGGQKGLKELMRLLRLFENQHQESSLPLDVIFVSIDLEVSRSERGAVLNDTAHIPYVKELGIATLDTRYIFTPQTPSFQQTRAIQTRQYSAAHASKDFEDCDITDFRECVFAETIRIQQDNLVPTINRCLRVQDTTSDTATSDNLRSIVLVGHSVGVDINILQRLGVDIEASFPIVAVIDTHSLSHHVSAADSQPSHFTLSGVLTWLGCSHKSHELHNAGNDATYTLYVMLLLALRWSEKREATVREAKNRELVRVFANREINEAPRWKPIRRALGAHTAAQVHSGTTYDTH